MPKFWHMYKITYSDFMVIVEPYIYISSNLKLFFLSINSIASNVKVLNNNLIYIKILLLFHQYKIVSDQNSRGIN